MCFPNSTFYRRCNLQGHCRVCARPAEKRVAATHSQATYHPRLKNECQTTKGTQPIATLSASNKGKPRQRLPVVLKAYLCGRTGKELHSSSIPHVKITGAAKERLDACGRGRDSCSRRDEDCFGSDFSDPSTCTKSSERALKYYKTL